MLKEFMELNTNTLLEDNLGAQALRRSVALGAALQLTEAALGRDIAYGRYLVEHLDETVLRIEGQLRLEPVEASGGSAGG